MEASNDLTPEQHQKIYLEEKARMDVRKQLEAEEITLQRERQLREGRRQREFDSLPQTHNQPTQNDGVAAVLSLVIPGAGQMYKDQVGVGLIWLFGTVLGYICLIIPGVIIHILCIVNAHSTPVGGYRK